MAISEAIISAASGLVGAGIGGFVSYKVAGEFWRREQLEATGPLVEARIHQYAKLWELTQSGTESKPAVWDKAKLDDRQTAMRRWYYEHGAGILLSDAARRQWSAVVQLFEEVSMTATPGAELDGETNEKIRKRMTCLRTRLKQDVHVHGPLIDDVDCHDQPGWSRRAAPKSH